MIVFGWSNSISIIRALSKLSDGTKLFCFLLLKIWEKDGDNLLLFSFSFTLYFPGYRKIIRGRRTLCCVINHNTTQQLVEDHLTGIIIITSGHFSSEDGRSTGGQIHPGKNDKVFKGGQTSFRPKNEGLKKFRLLK